MKRYDIDIWGARPAICCAVCGSAPKIEVQAHDKSWHMADKLPWNTTFTGKCRSSCCGADLKSDGNS